MHSRVRDLSRQCGRQARVPARRRAHHRPPPAPAASTSPISAAGKTGQERDDGVPVHRAHGTTSEHVVGELPPGIGRQCCTDRCRALTDPRPIHVCPHSSSVDRLALGSSWTVDPLRDRTGRYPREAAATYSGRRHATPVSPRTRPDVSRCARPWARPDHHGVRHGGRGPAQDLTPTVKSGSSAAAEPTVQRQLPSSPAELPEVASSPDIGSAGSATDEPGSMRRRRRMRTAHAPWTGRTPSDGGRGDDDEGDAQQPPDERQRHAEEPVSLAVGREERWHVDRRRDPVDARAGRRQKASPGATVARRCACPATATGRWSRPGDSPRVTQVPPGRRPPAAARPACAPNTAR